MRTAELMEIPHEELEAARKKAMDEVDGDDSWEKELDAKNRAKAGIDGPDAETLEQNAERLKRYEEKTDLSPYELLEKAQGCIGELKETYTEQAEQKAVTGARCFSECIQDGRKVTDILQRHLIILKVKRQELSQLL